MARMQRMINKFARPCQVCQQQKKAQRDSELQKDYDGNNSAYHNPAEYKEKKVSTTQQQYPSAIQ
jgi:hypothetical protein